MRWVGQVAVEKAGKEEDLDFRRKEVGDDVEACLPSGPKKTVI